MGDERSDTLPNMAFSPSEMMLELFPLAKFGNRAEHANGLSKIDFDLHFESNLVRNCLKCLSFISKILPIQLCALFTILVKVAHLTWVSATLRLGDVARA